MNKYFWKLKNQSYVALYSLENEKETFYYEILITEEKIENAILMNKSAFDSKWRFYFYNEEMIGITEMVHLDKIIRQAVEGKIKK
jgi:hypothetical protein